MRQPGKGAKTLIQERAVKLCDSLSMSICRRTTILRLLLSAAIRAPKLTIGIALLMLAALAGTMTYTGFLLVGVLADHLGTGRVTAGLLLGALLARFPWIRKGRMRIVGLLPGPVRRPFIVSLLALCLLSLLWRGEYVPALFAGFTTVFVLFFPWLRKTVFERLLSSVFKFAPRRNARGSLDDGVIEGEFREKKE